MEAWENETCPKKTNASITVCSILVLLIFSGTMNRGLPDSPTRSASMFQKGACELRWYAEDDQTKYRFLVDEEKAALAHTLSRKTKRA